MPFYLSGVTLPAPITYEWTQAQDIVFNSPSTGTVRRTGGTSLRLRLRWEFLGNSEYVQLRNLIEQSAYTPLTFIDHLTRSYSVQVMTGTLPAWSMVPGYKREGSSNYGPILYHVEVVWRGI